MKVIFVASRAFSDEALLARAMTVTIQDLLIKRTETRLLTQSLENRALQSMLMRYEDSTKSFLSQKGLSVNTLSQLATLSDPPQEDLVRVVSLGDIHYFPHKSFVRAKGLNGIETMEFK